MRRIGFIVLMLVFFFLPATGGAATLLPGELDRSDLLPPECLTIDLQGLEVFERIVADHRFGRRIFIWHEEGSHQITGGDWRIREFGGSVEWRWDRFRFDRSRFSSAVPEPNAAVAFGLGALMVAAAIRRR